MDFADPGLPHAGADPVDEFGAEVYRQIFRTASDAMLIISAADGCIRVANEGSARLFGFTTQELVGRSIEDLIPQRFRDAHVQHRARYGAAPTSRPMGMNLALSACHRDGHEFPVEISLSPVRFGDTQLVFASVRDVGSLQRAQDLIVRARQSNAVSGFGRLALASKDLRQIQHQACELIESHLGVDFALAARCELTGNRLRAESSVGFDEYTLARTLSRLGERLGERAHRLLDRPMLIEYERASPCTASDDAPKVMQSALLCAIPGEESDCLGLLLAGSREARSFTRDDSNFVQALANTIGAALQRERTEERLFQSQRLEALGQLTGGVAHDFNNLLTVVSGNLQMLEERTQDDPLAARLVKAAMRATGRGADLTRKLLAFSRRQTLQPRSIDVSALLDSLGDVLRRTLGAQIDVRMHVEPGLPAVRADPGMLDTALLNLAVNARDAMPDGGRLSLEARLVDASEASTAPTASGDSLAPGRYVRLAVTDTGTGMEPDVLARAFEPFFTTKDSGKGSGLGLSLVYGFARQSGGHVDVRSVPGGGTSIGLYLPIDESPAQSAPRQREAGYRGGYETILVVEDDDEVREVAVGFLRKLGYRVLQATDAPHALSLLDVEPGVELLFSDVLLRGEVNGPALAREALRRRPEMRVVFTSGHAPEALPSRELLLGAELLAKPYRIDQLARMLRRTLDAERGTADTPAAG